MQRAPVRQPALERLDVIVGEKLSQPVAPPHRQDRR
jgi:hypothetical protein